MGDEPTLTLWHEIDQSEEADEASWGEEEQAEWDAT